MFATGFFVIHDTCAGGQHDVAKMEEFKLKKIYELFHRNLPELTGWEQSVSPFLDVEDWNIEAGTDDTGLVKSAGEIDDDLSCTMIVNNFEFTDVAVLHHNCEELNDDLRVGADEDLTLASFFGIVDAFQGIC